MSKKVISIISSRGRGMDPELKLVKDSILASAIKPQFRYFIKNEATKNVAYAQGLKSAKKDLIKGSDHVICMDMSLNVAVEGMPTDGKKILLQIPFNYMHEAAVDKQNRPSMPNKKGSAEFTHIYSHSPFGTELLKNAYNIDGVEIIEGYCSPVSYRLASPETEKKIREILTYYYPKSEGKKILSIFMGGKVKDIDNWFMKKMNRKEFLDTLGNDWFLLTNSSFIMDLFRVTDYADTSNLGYIPQILNTAQAIGVSDILITNQGHYLSYQAARRKPVYTMEFSETNVDKYFIKNYPQLHIRKQEQLYEIVSHAEANRELHQKVAEYFSYDTDKDVMEDLISKLQ